MDAVHAALVVLGLRGDAHPLRSQRAHLPPRPLGSPGLDLVLCATRNIKEVQ